MFSKKSFYGKQREQSVVIQAKLARIEKDIKKNKIPTPYKSRLTGPSPAWKVFFRQADAFTFARMFGKDMWVFSFESDVFFDYKGQRLFLATNLDQFWHYYKQLDSDSRHHYEIIPEGSVCHLYFDLEYDKSINESCDGSAMTAIFIKCICEQLKRKFNVRCLEENVLQLDATTDAKYSCHLVFRLRNSAFHDNISAGHFVRELCAKIHNTVKKKEVKLMEPKDERGDLKNENHYSTESKRQKLDIRDAPQELDDNFLRAASVSMEELESLFVKDKKGGSNIFCDLGVYTKNRNFRLYLSCKKGKKNPLVLAANNKYKPHLLHLDEDHVQKELEKAYFLDSLVSRVRFSPTLKILYCEDTAIKDGPSHSKSSTSGTRTECFEGDRGSPYTEVDLYLKEFLDTRGHGGYLRRWSYFHQMELITYDVGGDRWCENIRRQHKSNNIMLVVDLRGGIFYQKCHDPDCRRANFRSKDWQLPEHVLPKNMLADNPWVEGEGEEYYHNFEELSDEQLLEFEETMFRGLREYDVYQEIAGKISTDSRRENLEGETSERHLNPNSNELDLEDVTDEQLMKLASQIFK